MFVHACSQPRIARILQDGSPSAVSDAILRLAHVLNAAGAYEDALVTIDGFPRDHPDHVLIRPNGLHLRGELHRKLGRSEAAELDFTASLELAHRLGTKFVELRAATSLGRILFERGQTAAARDLVAPLHGAFSQGFDTADLKEAQALDLLRASITDVCRRSFWRTPAWSWPNERGQIRRSGAMALAKRLDGLDFT